MEEVDTGPHALVTRNGRTWETVAHKRPGRESHPFDERAVIFARSIAERNPHIIFIQEFNIYALDVLMLLMPHLMHNLGLAESASSGDKMYQNPIFWDERVYDVDKMGAEWLTEDGNQGRGYGAKDPRSFTWVVLRNRLTGKRILVINTHLDHRSRRARYLAAAKIARFARKFKGVDAKIIGGDFNCSPLGTRAPYDVFERAGFRHAWTDAHPQEPLPPTMNNWGQPLYGMFADDGNQQAHIDGFMIAGDLQLVSASIFGENPPYGADHNGVEIEYT